MYTTKLGICIRITYTLFRMRCFVHVPLPLSLVDVRAVFVLRVHARSVKFFEKILSDYYTMYKFPCTLSHLCVARSRAWVVCG